MSQATPEMRNLARRLIAYEARHTKSSGTRTAETFAVWAKLRPALTALVGSTGAGALLSRGLALASPEVAWLRTVQVKSDGSFEGLDELRAQVSAEGITEGRVALITQIINLLNTLIGENLTMQVLRDVWPNLLIGDQISSRLSRITSGESHEV